MCLWHYILRLERFVDISTKSFAKHIYFCVCVFCVVLHFLSLCFFFSLSSSWFYFYGIRCYSYANIAVSQATNDFGVHVKSFSVYIEVWNSPLGTTIDWVVNYKTRFFAIIFPVNYVVSVLCWSHKHTEAKSFWWIDRKCLTKHFSHFSISDFEMCLEICISTYIGNYSQQKPVHAHWIGLIEYQSELVCNWNRVNCKWGRILNKQEIKRRLNRNWKNGNFIVTCRLLY